MSSSVILAPERASARVLTVAAALVAAGGATYSGLALHEGSKTAVVVPLAVGTALLLGVLALTRFGAYVMLMLALRSGIDLFKLSGSTAGNTAAETSPSRLLDPSTILAVLFLVAAALWLAARYLDRGLPGSPLRTALVAFGFAGVVSVAGSARPLSSAMEALRIISIIVMFAVLEQMMADRTQMKRLLVAAYASLLFPLVYTAVRFGLGNPPTEEKGTFTRVTGPFSQSNTFGRYLMIMVVFGVAIYPHVHRRWRLPLGLALALSGVFLLLTYTRTAIIGAVIGLVVVGWVQGNKRLLATLAVVGLCALLAVPQLASRFTSLTDTSSVGNQPTGNSLVWRLDYWTEVLPLANANPVTGIGLNMTQYNTDSAKQPHNDFIRAYVETGLVGLFAYIAALWLMVRTGLRGVRNSTPGSLDRAITAGFLGCAVCFVAVSAAANVISNVTSLWYLITFAAAASVIAGRSRTAPANEPVRADT